MDYSTLQKQYEEVVKNNVPPKFKTPEEQGKAIKKCTLFSETEIEYIAPQRIDYSKELVYK